MFETAHYCYYYYYYFTAYQEDLFWPFPVSVSGNAFLSFQRTKSTLNFKLLDDWQD